MKEPTDIDQLKKNCNVDGLIRILRFNKDPIVRKTVIDALVDIGEPATLPLIDLFRENNDDISGFVADALKRMSDLRSERQLIITLRDNTKGDPLFTVTGLAAIGGKESVNPLNQIHQCFFQIRN
jgi:HEAT repeat protein